MNNEKDIGAHKFNITYYYDNYPGKANYDFIVEVHPNYFFENFEKAKEELY